MRYILLLSFTFLATICYAQSGTLVYIKMKSNDSVYRSAPPDILILIPITNDKTAYYVTNAKDSIGIRIVDNKFLYNHVNMWHLELREKIRKGNAEKHYVPVYIKPHSNATHIAKLLATYVLLQNNIERYSSFTISEEEEKLVDAQL